MTGQQVMARLRERDGDGELRRLIDRFAKAHYVTRMELLDSRKAGASDARFAMWNRLMESGVWTYSRIGVVFGRDPTTVAKGVAVWRKRNGLPPLVVGQGRRYIPPGEATLPTSKEVA